MSILLKIIKIESISSIIIANGSIIAYYLCRGDITA